jgi:hypothetical protein
LIGLIWAIRRQKIPWKAAAIIGPFIFVSIGLLGAIRTSSWTGGTAADAFESAGWSDSFAKAQEEIAVRQSTSAQIPVVQRGFAVSGGPLLGETYLAAIAAPIPRAIWPEKPRGGGSIYAQMFLGASYEGFAVPLGPTVEMYWNFGVFGVLILSAIFGKLIRVVYNAFWRRYPNPFAIVFYVLFVSGFHFDTVSLVLFQQQLLLLLICYGAIKYLTPHQGQRIQATRRSRAPQQLATGPA